MKSLVGGFVSLLIIIVTFSYATSKMIDLSQKKDPFITQSEEEGFYDAEFGININEANFRFALGAYGFDGEAKNDPRYVKWIARVTWVKDGEEY